MLYCFKNIKEEMMMVVSVSRKNISTIMQIHEMQDAGKAEPGKGLVLRCILELGKHGKKYFWHHGPDYSEDFLRINGAKKYNLHRSIKKTAKTASSYLGKLEEQCKGVCILPVFYTFTEERKLFNQRGESLLKFDEHMNQLSLLKRLKMKALNKQIETCRCNKCRKGLSLDEAVRFEEFFDNFHYSD